MQTEQTIITVPLSQLSLSPKNSRKRRSTAHIAATLKSLKVHGQLQNLVVTPGASDGHYLVDAGGTRLLAFQLGVEEGDIAPDHPVRCLQIDDAIALEASAAENTIREEMHPADQFRAFRNLVDADKSTTEVAAHFSVPESVVVQRLKLANADPELFELYENGGMNLDQLQALSLTDDHEAQRLAWFGTKGAKIKDNWQRRPDQIRKRITAREIGPDNPLVKFVGTEAYEQADGKVRRDFFTTDVYFSDARLLEKLATERLAALAQAEKDAGWSWVDVHLELDYSGQSRYGRGPFSATRRALGKEEQKRLTSINARIAAIQEQQNDDDSEFDAALDNEADQLRGERAKIESAREAWSDEAKAKTGVLIYVDQYDGLRIERGRLQPGQKLKAGKVEGGKANGPKKPELTQDMLTRLERQRTAAIREHVAARPTAAITLLLQVLIQSMGSTRDSGMLSIDITNQHLADDPRGSDKFPDLRKAPARAALQERADKWLKAMPGKGGDLVAWLDKLSQEQRNELLALFVALSIPVSQHSGKAMAARFGVDMTTWWQPTPETYISLVPKSLLAEAVADVGGKAAGEALLTKKKDAAMAEAAKQLAGKGWLPKPLRGDGYALAKQGATAAKPADKTKPAPAKKAAPKPAPKKKPAAKKPVKKAAKSKAGAK